MLVQLSSVGAFLTFFRCFVCFSVMVKERATTVYFLDNLFVMWWRMFFFKFSCKLYDVWNYQIQDLFYYADKSICFIMFLSMDIMVGYLACPYNETFLSIHSLSWIDSQELLCCYFHNKNF